MYDTSKFFTLNGKLMVGRCQSPSAQTSTDVPSLNLAIDTLPEMLHCRVRKKLDYMKGSNR